MSDGIDPRVISAVDHVQKAALELIAAMRVALDVAEDMVADPAALGHFVQEAAAAARSVIPTPPPAQPSEPVERIPVD